MTACVPHSPKATTRTCGNALPSPRPVPARANTPANAGVFARAGTGRGDGSAFPQVRVVALGEGGTHAVIAAAMDSYAVGEVTLAKRLVAALQPGMLCLADRGFTAHPLFSAAAATGAALLWRAKNNAALPVLEPLPDGSFL